MCYRDVLTHEFEVVCSVHLGLGADSPRFLPLPPKVTVLTLYFSPAGSPQTKAALTFSAFVFFKSEVLCGTYLLSGANIAGSTGGITTLLSIVITQQTEM